VTDRCKTCGTVRFVAGDLDGRVLTDCERPFPIDVLEPAELGVTGAERRASKALDAARLDHWESRYVAGLSKTVAKRARSRAARRLDRVLVCAELARP